MHLAVKRIYDEPSEGDGERILVDRLWPRGMSREKASVDLWMRDIAPSGPLRKWYGHDRTRWDEFRRRYREELKAKEEMVGELRARCSDHVVTLLYSTRERVFNNAEALRQILMEGQD